MVLRAPADGSLSLEELSSRFYTVIPHNFGRNRPPPINSPELLQAKKDMLLVTFSRGAGNGADGQTGQGRRETCGREGPERWTEWVAGRTGRGRPGRWLGWGCTGGQTGGWPWSQSCGTEEAGSRADRQAARAHHFRCWQTSSWPRPCRRPPRRRRWRRRHTHWTGTTSSLSASSSCWTQRQPSTRCAESHRGARPTVGTVPRPSALLVCRGIACPWPSLPVSLGPEESSGTAGGSGAGPHISPPRHPASAFPAGDPYLPRADWQQLPVPGSSACLESEPGRGGEGESPQPIPLITCPLRR